MIVEASSSLNLDLIYQLANGGSNQHEIIA